MKRLLVRDPRYRLTTKEALMHPFITGASYFPRYTTPSGNAAMSTTSLNARSISDMDVETAPQLSPAQANQILERYVIVPLLSHTLMY